MLWGITRKDEMMPRWSPTDYLHGAAAAFWEIFEASAKTVEDNNVNRDNSQREFAFFQFQFQSSCLNEVLQLVPEVCKIIQHSSTNSSLLLVFFVFPRPLDRRTPTTGRWQRMARAARSL